VDRLSWFQKIALPMAAHMRYRGPPLSWVSRLWPVD
jgi:hypothetical protein